MKIHKIYDFLNELSPFELQESWDNSGLLIGSFDDEVKKIHVCLDIDSNALKCVEPNTLFVTHHPLIFKNIKSLDLKTYPSSLIKELIKKDCALISMHTNIDKTHLNRYLVEEILGEKIEKIDGFVCFFDTNMTFDDLTKHAKSVFKLEHIRVVSSNKKIKRVAFCSGSGGDFIENIKADCFLTGDLKYHQAFYAMENNMALIDIGHFESECFFAGLIASHLKNLPLQVIMTHSKNPFEYK